MSSCPPVPDNWQKLLDDLMAEEPTQPGGHQAPQNPGNFSWPQQAAPLCPPPATPWWDPEGPPTAPEKPKEEEGPKECPQCGRPRPYKNEKTGRWTCWCCGKEL